MSEGIFTWFSIAFASSMLVALVWAVLNLRVNEKSDDDDEDKSDE